MDGKRKTTTKKKKEPTLIIANTPDRVKLP